MFDMFVFYTTFSFVPFVQKIPEVDMVVGLGVWPNSITFLNIFVRKSREYRSLLCDALVKTDCQRRDDRRAKLSMRMIGKNTLP